MLIEHFTMKLIVFFALLNQHFSLYTFGMGVRGSGKADLLFTCENVDNCEQPQKYMTNKTLKTFIYGNLLKMHLFMVPLLLSKF